MTTKNSKIWSLLVLALVLRIGGAMAQSGGCSSNMINGLSSCIGYLRGNSSRPLPSCCTSLASVGQSQPECLCPMLSNGATSSLGIAINRTLAMALPATCKLQTPQCDDDAANGPVASSPTMSSPSDDSTPAYTDPSATGPTSDFPTSGSKIVPNNTTTSYSTTSIYLNIVTLLMAAWIVDTCRFWH